MRWWGEGVLLAGCQGGKRLQARLQALKLAIVCPLSYSPFQNFLALHSKYVYLMKVIFKTVLSNV